MTVYPMTVYCPVCDKEWNHGHQCSEAAIREAEAANKKAEKRQARKAAQEPRRTVSDRLSEGFRMIGESEE